MDCLPIYYAERMGLFEAEGVSVQIGEYLSQMDCDTALQNGRMEIAYTDIPRTLQMKKSTHIVTALEGKMSLVTARTKRIRNLKHLNERMVALDRLSQADYWSDQVMLQAGLDQSAIYRPQFNDIRLRTSMLTEQLVDAALLPEPYVTQAALRGNRSIFMTPDSAPQLACLATLQATWADTLRHTQIEHFIAAYDKAVKEMNGEKRNDDTLRSILKKQYALSSEVCDSLRLPHFRKAHQPRSKDTDIAAHWLKGRKNIK